MPDKIKIQIRLLLSLEKQLVEKSNQGMHLLLFHKLRLAELIYSHCSSFRGIIAILGLSQSVNFEGIPYVHMRQGV